MKLSIIVPVYNMNKENRLTFCLHSLLNQTIQEYEVIAVDDCSTDDSLAVLQSMAASHPDKLKVMASPVNQKQGGAKNMGLRAAKGEWIGFVDSDDWIAPDMYAKLLEKAEAADADIAGCDYYITDEQSFAPGRRVYNNTAEQTGILEETQYRKLLLAPGSMVIKVYKREIFAEHDLWFPEHIFYEDNCTAPLAMLYAKRFERVDEALYYYYQHDTSTVHTISEERCNHRLEACRLFREECSKRGFYEKYRNEIAYQFFVLGYKNTLFSYMQGVKRPRISYMKKLKTTLLSYEPDFQSNPYYMENTDAETRRLINMHMRSNILFWLYYKLLWLYRRSVQRIRSKKECR